MDSKTIKLIKKFLAKLRKKIKVEKVILFGSRSTNDYLENSDVDLILVSKDFEGMDFDKRMRFVYDYWDFNYPVDFFCYTPNEFNKLSKMITIVSEALKKGIIIV